jgi:peptidoglycan/LPS O-acetylase OafA/YrhL
MSFATFARVRLIRLYPLYILGLVISLVYLLAAVHAHISKDWSYFRLAHSFVFTATFLPDVVAFMTGDTRVAALNPPSWSLMSEIYINVLFALLAVKLSGKLAEILTVIFAIVLLVYCLILGPFGSVNLINYTLGGMLRCAYGFTCGIVLYKLSKSRVPALLPARNNTSIAAALMAVVLLLLMINVPDGARAAYDLVCVYIFFPAIIFVAASFNPKPAGYGLFAWLGAVSYPLYAVHFPIEKMLTSILQRWKGGILIAPLPGVAMLAGLVVLSFLLYKYFDLPVRTFINRRLKAKRA